jgi:DNA-binding NtrC family response regulator
MSRAAPLPTVLLIDDERHALASMRMALEDEFDCLTAETADEGWRLMEDNFVQVIFCDQRMPGKTGVEFLAEVRERWPGNLRELENEVTRMLIFAQDRVLGPELISRHILQADPSEDGADRSADQVLTAEGTLKDRVELIEMRILRETLTRLKWNKSRAAAELGLSRVGLRAKLDRYGITPPRKTPAETEED